MEVKRYGPRYWAVYDKGVLICVTVYKKGALEVIRRLHELVYPLHNEAGGLIVQGRRYANETTIS